MIEARIRLFLTLTFAFVTSIASAATSFQVALPNNATTGTSFSFSVTALNGDVVDTAYTGTVHFTSSDSGATLPADYTFVAGDAGTHTFNATMATAGQFTSTRNQSITATDTANASITGFGVTTVEWAPDVVRAIRVEAPETVDRTVSFNGTVSALNADLQVVPSYLGTVHFTGTDGVTLPADYTFTVADNGVHTFTFSASRGGHHLITAADVAQPSISGSSGFQVNCPELTATAENTGPVCSNSPVILHGSSNQSGVNYIWTGPHTWFSTEQNPTAPGPGTYFLEVNNSDGCRSFASTTVGTVTPPQMTLTGSATEACGGDTFTVTVNDSSSFTNFVWEASGATILSGQGTPTVQLQAENLNVLATVFVRGIHVATGCSTNPALSYRVDVDPRHSAEITAPSSACPNATITASVPDTFNAAYTWSITNGTITTGGGHTIEFVPNGTGDVTVTAIVHNNLATCASTDTAVISLDGPTASVDANLEFCPGNSIDIPVTLSGTAPFTITWSDGVVQSGILSTQTVRTVAPLDTTFYSITAVSDSLCAGSATGSAMVTARTAPEILTAPENVVISRGMKTTLSVEAAGSDLTYRWYEGHPGDHSHLVATSADFETPALQRTTKYWVEVIGPCDSSAMATATVAVMGRQRSARH